MNRYGTQACCVSWLTKKFVFKLSRHEIPSFQWFLNRILLPQSSSCYISCLSVLRGMFLQHVETIFMKPSSWPQGCHLCLKLLSHKNKWITTTKLVVASFQKKKKDKFKGKDVIACTNWHTVWSMLCVIWLTLQFFFALIFFWRRLLFRWNRKDWKATFYFIHNSHWVPFYGNTDETH